jgi:peptidyl-prolyl cis-trans isomerase SurA
MKNLRALLATAVAASLTLSARAELVNAIKVVVHDAVVTQYEVEDYTAAAEDELRRRFRTQEEVYQRELLKALNENLEERLRRQLILHEFKAGGYNIPEPILESAVQEEIDKRGGRERLTKILNARGMTWEKFRQQTRESIILSALRAKNISQEIIISPHKIESYYLANQSDYKLENQVKLRRIMLKNTADGRDAAATRQLAGEIRAKVKTGSAFSEMASMYTELDDKREGGLWGWLETSALNTNIVSAVSSLKPGEVSDVIELGNAHYLFLLEDKRTAHHKPLNEVRDEIEANLLKEERDRLEKQWIERLKKKTFVRYF